MAQTGPHMTGAGTHPQILTDLSNTSVLAQSTFCTHWQTPPQSRPPLFGSQASRASSTQLPPPGHLIAPRPPQNSRSGSGTQAATGGHGAFTHMTGCSSQCVPAAQSIVAQVGPGAGAPLSRTSDS